MQCQWMLMMSEFKPSKREIKRRLKAQKAMNKDLALKIKVI